MAIFYQIEAFGKFYHRHVVDILRIKFTNNEELWKKCILGQPPRSRKLCCEPHCLVFVSMFLVS
jgi:hypothetical protein